VLLLIGLIVLLVGVGIDAGEELPECES
jgi:hypothetical protein